MTTASAISIQWFQGYISSAQMLHSENLAHVECLGKYSQLGAGGIIQMDVDYANVARS